MDGIYIVPSEEKPKEQGPPDAWLMGGAFNSMNNLPRDATVNNTQDAEADAIGANGALLDPENFLTGEIHFPDLADLSPRGVGPQEDNGKPSGSGHDNIPPDMISIGKPPFEGSQMQVDTSTGNSFADTNVPTSEEGAGAGRTPISNLGSNPLDSMNIPFDAALHGGIGTASLSSQGVKMDSIVHPSNAPLSAKNDAELQGFPAAETEVEMPSTKRRKTTTRRGSGGPGKTKSKSAKAASSSADGESGKAKGSSSKRSATPRGRSVRIF